MNKSMSKKEITKTACDSVNCTVLWKKFYRTEHIGTNKVKGWSCRTMIIFVGNTYHLSK